MKDEIKITRGSGNIFRDLGRGDADLEQLRAILAAKIIGVLDDRQLSVRRAGEITGIAAADFSRIRRANLDRFTVDRRMTILARLDQHVDVTVTVTARRRKQHHAPARPPHWFNSFARRFLHAESRVHARNHPWRMKRSEAMERLERASVLLERAALSRPS